MGSGTSWFIAAVSVANILACLWLIWWSSRPIPGESAKGEVMGHSWDGDLQEYNNPLPRWWLYLFYITIVFSLIYLVFYPGLGRFAGVLGWSQEGQYDAEVAGAQAKYDPIFNKFAQQDVAALIQDTQALRIGQRLYVTYCAGCHGSDAKGAVGFPSLADGDWLWGGTPEAIKTSILNGRQGNMPSATSLGMSEQDIDNLVAHIQSLSGREVDAQKAAAGKEKFLVCAGCHGADGKGNQMLGAPNLADDAWLYGGSLGAINETLVKGRMGVMPAHKEFLGEAKSHILSAYVYSLSAK
jgi:cytochrome c oxidase cbb3-type subunit III